MLVQNRPKRSVDWAVCLRPLHFTRRAWCYTISAASDLTSFGCQVSVALVWQWLKRGLEAPTQTYLNCYLSPHISRQIFIQLKRIQKSEYHIKRCAYPLPIPHFGFFAMLNILFVFSLDTLKKQEDTESSISCSTFPIRSYILTPSFNIFLLAFSLGSTVKAELLCSFIFSTEFLITKSPPSDTIILKEMDSHRTVFIHAGCPFLFHFHINSHVNPIPYGIHMLPFSIQ